MSERRRSFRRWVLARRWVPAVGVQLGYRGGFAQGDWHDDVRDLDIHDPEALQDGFFVRLLVGWAWSVGQTYTVIERVERCTKPDCWVRCDRGFADCDFDPRNGCESPERACTDPSVKVPVE